MQQLQWFDNMAGISNRFSVSLHNEALDRLCLVCGGAFVNQDNYYPRNDYEKKLEEAFYYDFTKEGGDDYPTKICDKCYWKMTNVLKRKTTNNFKAITTWKPSETDCQTCKLYFFAPQRHGGKKTKQKIRTGRRSNTLVWSRAKSEELKEKILDTVNGVHEVPIESFKTDLNPQLDLCTCSLCDKLVKKPVLVTKCEHIFCFVCLMRVVEGLEIQCLVCPKCTVPIHPDDVVASNSTGKLVNSLRLGCSKGCSKAFPCDKLGIRSRHEEECNGPDGLITDKAVAKIIKEKIAKSTLPNKSVSFSTGGPRVIILFFESVTLVRLANLYT